MKTDEEGYEDKMKMVRHYHFDADTDVKTIDVIRICTITTPSVTIDLKSADRSENMNYLVDKSLEILERIKKG